MQNIQEIKATFINKDYLILKQKAISDKHDRQVHFYVIYYVEQDINFPGAVQTREEPMEFYHIDQAEAAFEGFCRLLTHFTNELSDELASKQGQARSHVSGPLTSSAFKSVISSLATEDIKSELKITFINKDVLRLQRVALSVSDPSTHNGYVISYGEHMLGNYGEDVPSLDKCHYMVCGTQYFSFEQEDEAFQTFCTRITDTQPYRTRELLSNELVEMACSMSIQDYLLSH